MTIEPQARARKVAEHNAEAYAVLNVYSFADAQRCYIDRLSSKDRSRT